MKFGQYLAYLRTKYQVTKKDLGIAIGAKSGDYIYSLEKSKSKPPSYEVLIKMTHRLCCTKDEGKQLFALAVEERFSDKDAGFLSERLSEYPERKHWPRIPIINFVSAGTPSKVDDDEVRGWIETMSTDPAAFSLCVKGNSMVPKYEDGYYLTISPRKEAQEGRDVVIYDKKENKSVLKKYFYKNGITIFKSINPDYEDIIVTEDEKDRYDILGVVIECHPYAIPHKNRHD